MVEKFELTRPAYRGYDLSDLSKINWIDWIAVEAKFDGMRIQIVHDGRDVYFFSDENKDKTSRLPYQTDEVQSFEHSPFILDSECIIVKNGKARHRTETNALLNGKFPPDEQAKNAYLMVFDVLKFDGRDIRDQPLHERLEYLNQFKDSEHVKFIRHTKNLDEESYGYLVKISDEDGLRKAFEKVARI